MATQPKYPTNDFLSVKILKIWQQLEVFTLCKAQVLLSINASVLVSAQAQIELVKEIESHAANPFPQRKESNAPPFP